SPASPSPATATAPYPGASTARCGCGDCRHDNLIKVAPKAASPRPSPLARKTTTPGMPGQGTAGVSAVACNRLVSLLALGNRARNDGAPAAAQKRRQEDQRGQHAAGHAQREDQAEAGQAAVGRDHQRAESQDRGQSGHHNAAARGSGEEVAAAFLAT